MRGAVEDPTAEVWPAPLCAFAPPAASPTAVPELKALFSVEPGLWRLRSPGRVTYRRCLSGGLWQCSQMPL